MYPRTIASTLMTSHFLTIMLRPASWSLYSSSEAGKPDQAAAGVAVGSEADPEAKLEGTGGATTWWGRMCCSF